MSTLLFVKNLPIHSTLTVIMPMMVLESEITRSLVKQKVPFRKEDKDEKLILDVVPVRICVRALFGIRSDVFLREFVPILRRRVSCGQPEGMRDTDLCESRRLFWDSTDRLHGKSSGRYSPRRL